MNTDLSTVSRSAELSGYQLRNPHRPARVVRPTTADHVVNAVRASAEDHQRVTVQATGHGRTRSVAGETLILTAGLDQIRIDPAGRTARVGAGTRWSTLIAAAARYGLAPLSGSATSVGAVGYTLGGGFGLLSPRFGYAADHVRAVELVTPDGRLRRITAVSDPELFWAVRGAGAQFGVVTAIEIDLFAVEQLIAGTVLYDLGADPDVLQRWQHWCDEQPAHLLAAATVLPLPDAPGVPEALRGRLVAHLHLAWSDASSAADEAVRGLRSLGRPLHDTVTTLPYTRSNEIFADPDTPGRYRGSGWLLNELPAAALDELPEQLRQQEKMAVVGIRRLGGAMATPPSVPNAVGHRGAAWSFGILSPEDTDEDAERTRTNHDRLLRTWQPSVLGRALNFTFDDLDPAEVSRGWDAESVPRLRKLLTSVDPDQMMIANHPLR